MAYFWTCALKKRGKVFTRVGLLLNLYSVIELWPHLGRWGNMEEDGGT